jgi:hypothetical protein
MKAEGLNAEKISWNPSSFFPTRCAPFARDRGNCICCVCRGLRADLSLDRNHSDLARLSWAQLLKRAFEIDLEHCPHCGGPLKIIAAIEHPPVIAKILNPLRLARPRTAPIARAVIRSIPNGLIPRVPLPDPTASLGRHPPERPKRSRIRAPRTAEAPGTSRILDRRVVSLTTHRSIGTLPLAEKSV